MNGFDAGYREAPVLAGVGRLNLQAYGLEGTQALVVGAWDDEVPAVASLVFQDAAGRQGISKDVSVDSEGAHGLGVGVWVKKDFGGDGG